MSSAPISSRVRAQSIDSAIEGGFFRSSARIEVDDLDQLARQRLGQLRGVQADDLHLALDLGVVEPEVEAAALQRLGQLARVVRGEDDDRHRRRRRPGPARESRSGSRRAAPAASPRTPGRSCRSRRSAGPPGRGWRSPASAAARAGTPRRRCRRGRPPSLSLAAGLDPQQLLAVVPLVQRLGLVEALVALQADQLALAGARQAPWPARSCRPRPGPRPGSACRAAGRGRRPAPPTRRRGRRPRRAPALIVGDRSGVFASGIGQR